MSDGKIVAAILDHAEGRVFVVTGHFNACSRLFGVYDSKEQAERMLKILKETKSLYEFVVTPIVRNTGDPVNLWPQ